MMHNKIYSNALKESKETIEIRIEHEYFLRKNPNFRKIEPVHPLSDQKIKYLKNNFDNLAQIISDFTSSNIEILKKQDSSLEKLFHDMIHYISFCFVHGEMPDNSIGERSSLNLARNLAKVYTDNLEFFKKDYARKDVHHPFEVKAVDGLGFLFFYSADNSIIKNCIDIYWTFYDDTLLVKYIYDKICNIFTSPYEKQLKKKQKILDFVKMLSEFLIKKKILSELQENKLKYFMIDRTFGATYDLCFTESEKEKEQIDKRINMEYELLISFLNSKYNKLNLDLEKIEDNMAYKDFLKKELPNHQFCHFLYLMGKKSCGSEKFSKYQKALRLLQNEECDSIEEIIEVCQLEIPNYSLIKRLGVGTYKKVYLGRNIISDVLKAVSIFDISERGKVNMEKRRLSLLDMVKKETKKTEKLNNIDNSRILKINEISYEEKSKKYILITELMDKTLQNELEEKGRLPEKQVLQYLSQVIDGLDAMHKNRMAHSDITLENIGIKNGNLKLMDFGLTSTVSEFNEKKINTGSIDTRAPELFEGKKATTRSDMWSLGCIMYRMLAGEYPFLPGIKKPKEPGEGRYSYEKKVYNLIKSKDIKESLETLKLSKQTKDIIKKCLERNPKKRIKNASELKTVVNIK